nr:DNA repair protein RAD50 [Tanacetum cinerariifolium]
MWGSGWGVVCSWKRAEKRRKNETIVECLKLSCTGELPPNVRSGQSFIHDP